MKFEKEALSTAVKAKLTIEGKHLSISDKTLNDMVSNLYAFASEETELDDFVNSVLPTFETVQGQLRNEYSAYTKKWEKDHPEPKPAPNEPPAPNATDPTLKALLEKVEKMEKAQQEREAAQAIATKKSALLAKLKEKGIEDNEWTNDYFEGLSITADTDVDARAEAALRLYNKSKAIPNNIVPGQPGTNEPDDKDMFADIAALRKKD